MLRHNAATRLTKRAEKENAEKISNKKSNKAPKRRNLAITKSQLMKKCSKTTNAAAINYLKQVKQQATKKFGDPLMDNGHSDLPDTSFHFEDDGMDYGIDSKDSPTPSEQYYVPTTVSYKAKQKRIRKDY